MTRTGTDNLLKCSRLKDALDNAFLLLVGVYLVCLCTLNATYVLPAYTFPDQTFFTKLFLITAFVVLLKTDSTHGWDRRLLAALFVFAIYFMAYRTGRENSLLFLPVLTLGAVGMNSRSIYKVYVAAVGGFLLVTVLSSFTGLIPNLVHFRAGHLRSSWGIAYETDFASLVLFLTLIIWLCSDRISNSTTAILALISFAISFFIADSRTAELCSVLLFLFTILSAMERKAGNGNDRLRKYFYSILVCSFLLFAAVFLVALVAYAQGGELGQKMDLLLSNRLAQTMEVYKDQGILPFGSNYSPIGRGGSDIQPETIYFIDSSYPLIMIRYGWVLFVAIAVLWTWMGTQALRLRYYKFIYVMTVIAFHAMSEHHFLDVQYNILLIMPFAVLNPQIDEMPGKVRNRVDSSSNWVVMMCLMAAMLVALAAAPWLFSRLRTTFQTLNADSGNRMLIALAVVILLATSYIVFWIEGACLIKTIRKKQGARKHQVAILLSCVIAVGCICIWSNRIIRDGEEQYLPEIEEEHDVIQTVLSTAEGKVYSEDLPELYRKSYPGICRTAWSGDDLARLHQASVLVRTEKDRQRFIDMGFLFTRISNRHALYSNDSSVIQALYEEGYTWTDYDSTIREIDLELMAELNDIPISEQGAILLRDGDAIRRGPNLELYQGQYEVHFQLKASQVSDEAEDGIAMIQITDYNNGHVLASTSLQKNQIDDEEKTNVTLQFYTYGSRNVRFMVDPEEDCVLEVIGIQYRKIHR